MIEQWVNFTDVYQVSNLGRIKNSISGYILKLSSDKQGYQIIQINRKNLKVHRLVSTAFISNPDNKRCVNHKDGVKSNNIVDNLEWATHHENAIHAFSTGLKIPQQLGKSGKLHHGSKPLLSIKDTAIIEHESRSLCAQYLGVHVKAINSAMAKGHYCKGHKLYSL